MEMDEMTCVCGEVLRGEKGKGELARQYQEHMLREDHKSSPAQWATAYEKIQAGKERAKAKEKKAEAGSAQGS